MNEVILLCAGAAPDAVGRAGAGLQAPAQSRLNALLVRGSQIADRQLAGEPLAELPEDDWLRHRLGVPAPLSMLALEGACHAINPPYWRLTPCQLHLGMDHAMLIDPTQLRLEAAESAALLHSVSAAFEACGLRLLAPSPDTWFALGEPWDLQCYPWTLASGRNISAYQPSGPRARDWRRLLTEVQMTWHEHPVNHARAERGLRPVNALWLDGFVPGPVPRSAGHLMTDNPAWRGAALAAGWSVDATDGAWPADPPEGPSVIDLGFWRLARRLGDVAGWQQAWPALERWLAEHEPALRAAAAGRGLSVVFTGERRQLVLTARSGARWRFWQRLDALALLRGDPDHRESIARRASR